IIRTNCALRPSCRAHCPSPVRVNLGSWAAMERLYSFGELAERTPEGAHAVRDLLYQYPVGLATLASVRQTGAPRIDRFSPMVDLQRSGEIYGFFVPSYKLNDLRERKRFVMQSYPRPAVRDLTSCKVWGIAEEVERGPEWDAVAAAYLKERPN